MRLFPRRVFYGWWIALGGAAWMAVNGAVYSYGFGAFFTPLVTEFGWSRAGLAGALSVSRFEGGVLAPVAGVLLDRFGPRKLMFLGIALKGAGFILLSQIDSLAAFYLVFVLGVSAGSSFGAGQAPFVAVGNWFIRRRGTAMGLLTAGFGLGGAAVPLLAMVIVALGWRSALVLVGIVVWLVGFPLAALMRHRPEQYGQRPDGGQSDPQLSPTALASAVSHQPADASMTPREVLRSQAFWLLNIVFNLRFLVTSAMVVHQIPFLEDLGFSPAVAASILGAIAMTSVPGRLLFGWLADHYDKRFVIGSALGLMSLGMLVMAGATDFGHVLVYVPLYGLGYGGLVPLTSATLAEYFGRKNLGTVLGFSNTVTMVGGALGPIFAGYVFDVTGSYRLAFTVFTGACLVALAVLLAVRRPIRLGEPVQAVA